MHSTYIQNTNIQQTYKICVTVCQSEINIGSNVQTVRLLSLSTLSTRTNRRTVSNLNITRNYRVFNRVCTPLLPHVNIIFLIYNIIIHYHSKRTCWVKQVITHTIILKIFSSPEPKARVSYCHSAPSVVRPSVVRPA